MPRTESFVDAQAAEGALEESLGFPLFQDGEDKLGWLMNYNAVCSSGRFLAKISGASFHEYTGN